MQRYVPIIAEGYIPYTDFTETGDVNWGASRKTINVTNTGFMLFPKYSVILSDGTVKGPGNRRFRVFRTSGSGGMQYDGVWAGDIVNCMVNSDSVQFYHSRNNPTNLTIGSGNSVVASHGAKVAGVRYYIFGIPTSL